MNEIRIELNKQEFVGGETVTGAVIVQLDQDTPVRGIHLKLEGYEKSSWREGGGKHRHTHTQTHSFFDEELLLYGRPRLGLGALLADSLEGFFVKGSYELLRAGTYQYPFSYVLPPRLPGGYESALTSSRIYYGLKAQVDLPLKFDLAAVQPLVIHEPANGPAMHGVIERKTKKFLFHSDSLMEAAVHLEKDRFRLGETLLCCLEVTNRAPGKGIRAATLSLLEIETAYADGQTHEAPHEIARVKFEQHPILVKEHALVDLKLDIPEDLYPTISGATLVKLNYELQVALDIPWAVDMKLNVPVVLLEVSDRAVAV